VPKMSSSSLDYITNSAKSVLETLFPESSSRQKRIQELIIEIEDMVASPSYFLSRTNWVSFSGKIPLGLAFRRLL